MTNNICRHYQWRPVRAKSQFHRESYGCDVWEFNTGNVTNRICRYYDQWRQKTGRVYFTENLMDGHLTQAMFSMTKTYHVSVGAK